MDASAVIALISSILGVVLLVSGGVIKYLLGRLSVAETLVDTKQETIEEQRRQLSEYRITAKLQERFFSQLPPAPYPPQGSRGDQ